MSVMGAFLRGRTTNLTNEERQLLEDTVSDARHVPGRTTLVKRNDVLDTSTMLMAGFMVRFIDDEEGGRQIVAFHVPGDFVDLHGFALGRLDHGLATLTEAEIGVAPHAALERLMSEAPDLARKLWFSTLLDAAMHREWLFRFGRLDGAGRLAHFLAETEARLRAVGLSDGRRFLLPINQTDLAEIVGITPIHVNRVLRTLREDGVVVFRSGRVDILDRERLLRIGQFKPAYLYLAEEEREGPPVLEEGLHQAI